MSNLESPLGHLVVRADATSHIGAGHLMRCLTLGRTWLSGGGAVTVLSHCGNDVLADLVASFGIEFIHLEKTYPDPVDITRTLEVLERVSDNGGTRPWLVVDGYNFRTEYHEASKTIDSRLLVVDDLNHLQHYAADVVINQNINADRFQYAHAPTTRLLLGTQYVLLRPDFLVWRDHQRSSESQARRLLVTLGGGDSIEPTIKVVEAMREADLADLETVIVIGPISPDHQALETAIGDSGCKIRLVRNANNMPELMVWADMAVSAGGSTCWEMAFMRLPNIILTTADNQQHVVAGLGEEGIADVLGWWQQVDRAKIATSLCALAENGPQRRTMGERGRELVDGLGSDRVLSILKEYS